MVGPTPLCILRIRLIAGRFIERVTNNVEICVSDIHVRLECGGPTFHMDDNKVPWPYFAVGLRVERFNMGRVPPPDAKKVTTSFGIGDNQMYSDLCFHLVSYVIRI